MTMRSRSTWPAPARVRCRRTAASAAARSRTDCKHAAAVLIVARHLAAAARLVERPEWEKTLDKLLAGSPTVLPADVAPLALEFGVERIPAVPGLRRTPGSADPARPTGPQRDLGPVGHQLGRPGLRGPLLRVRAPRAVAAVPGGGRGQRPLFAAAQRLALAQHGQHRILGAARPGGGGRVDRDHRQAAARSDPDRASRPSSASMPGARRTGWSCGPGSPWPATIST